MPNTTVPADSEDMPKLVPLNIIDMLTEARDWCEAGFMAAAAIGDMEQTNAIQLIAGQAKERIMGALEALADFRDANAADDGEAR